MEGASLVDARLIPQSLTAEVVMADIVLTATPHADFGLAKVAARKGQGEALVAAVERKYGIRLPDGPVRAMAADVSFAGIGRGMWLAASAKGGNAFVRELSSGLAGLASVTDQSDGYALFRIVGSGAGRGLEKFFPVDVDPRAFPPGSVASTLAAHMGCTLWRAPDDKMGDPVFETIVFRSFAEDFWKDLLEAFGAH